MPKVITVELKRSEGVQKIFRRQKETGLVGEKEVEIKHNAQISHLSIYWLVVPPFTEIGN